MIKSHLFGFLCTSLAPQHMLVLSLESRWMTNYDEVLTKTLQNNKTQIFFIHFEWIRNAIKSNWYIFNIWFLLLFVIAALSSFFSFSSLQPEFRHSLKHFEMPTKVSWVKFPIHFVSFPNNFDYANNKGVDKTYWC